MKLNRAVILTGVWSMCIGILALPSMANDTPNVVEKRIEKQTYKISGPYQHKNMAVYLVHAPKKNISTQKFITLEQGLRSGKVLVNEMRNQTVSKVLVVNRSSEPLYLQEGDRIYGGKQDRIISSPLVIAPKIGPVTVPCKCVESGRWRGNTNRFTAPNSTLLAPKNVRLARS